MWLPDRRVTGATPASAASDQGSGNRDRQSPISARSRAARSVPARGEAGEDVRVGVGGQLAGDLGLQGLDLGGQAGHGGGQRRGDGGLGGAVAAGRTRRR